MKCKNAKILISASMDGELSQREERRLREHVCRCAECAREQAQVSNLRDVMAVWADEDPSEWLAQNFACRLEDEFARKPARRVYKQRRVLGTALAGFATALLAFGILLHNQLAPVQPIPPAPAGNVQSAHDDGAVAVKPNISQPDKPVVTVPSAKTPARTNTVRPPKHTVAGPSVPPPNVAPTVDANPGPTPPVGRVATTGSTRNSRPNLADRGSTGRDAEVKRMVMRNVMLASHTEGNAESAIADHIVHADLAMNRSVEEVRGVIRKAVDVLARSENRVEPIRNF